jgi:hypothetical protein
MWATKRRATTARPSITDLHAQFEKARAAASAIPSAKEAEFDRAAAKVGRIAARIAKAQANNLDEMLLETGAVTKEGGYEEDHDCVLSIRDDLHRLCQGSHQCHRCPLC